LVKCGVRAALRGYRNGDWRAGRLPVLESAEIERPVEGLARAPNGGGGDAGQLHHDQSGVDCRTSGTASCAGGLPIRCFVQVGGLASCGHDLIDDYRRAASYVGRILRGEKPADLPV
jgi:putative ABC transport system substrate-binding protein